MNEQINNVLRGMKSPPVLSGVFSGAVMFGIGYLVGKRKKEVRHEVPTQEWTLDQLLENRNRESPNILEADPETLEDGEAFIRQRFEEVSAPYITEAEDPPQPEARTIFAHDSADQWNYETEVAQRDEELPYILHRDEFMEDERSFAQITLTYYSGDDILCDQENTPVPNHQKIVGELKFGHGTPDPNCVYIRNAKLRAEYEVIRDDGSYAVEVLGGELEPPSVTELKHSADRKYRED